MPAYVLPIITPLTIKNRNIAGVNCRSSGHLPPSSSFTAPFTAPLLLARYYFLRHFVAYECLAIISRLCDTPINLLGSSGWLTSHHAIWGMHEEELSYASM